MTSKRVYLSLGSNLGERAQNLERAIQALEQQHIHVIARSSVYETEPRDVMGQAWFLNAVVECETHCFPLQLLGTLQNIENQLGRVRSNAVRRGPRTIDIDILLFGNVVMNTPRLAIPHPRMLDRRFVLQPLLEIVPDLKDSETKQALTRYLNKVADQKVRKIETNSPSRPTRS